MFIAHFENTRLKFVDLGQYSIYAATIVTEEKFPVVSDLNSGKYHKLH